MSENSENISLEKILEAMLFAAVEPMKVSDFADAISEEAFMGFGTDEATLKDVLDILKEKYAADEYVFELKEINGGFQLFTKKVYYPYVKHAALLKHKKKLSRSALETLSIIAYRQPVTKPEVEYIRGVNCDYTIKMLLEKNLVEITGRSDAAGRPLLYGTSPHFMEYFGINSLEDLPKLTEISEDEEGFQAQFKMHLNTEEE